jgi:anti-sigma factor RsiW
MQCEDVRELLGNYIDEELTETMRRRIESHLAGCPACAGDLATLHTAVARLQSAAAPEPPNAWHFERLLDRLARDHDTPLTSGASALHPMSQLSLNIITDEEDR